jgi:hypothetical protein
VLQLGKEPELIAELQDEIRVRNDVGIAPPDVDDAIGRLGRHDQVRKPRAHDPLF